LLKIKACGASARPVGFLCAKKAASETTGDEWQAGTLIWLNWAGMSGSKKGKNAGPRILLLGLPQSIVTRY
jgi:hypothetical protein